MSVNYSVIQRIKPGDAAAPRKYYALAKSAGEVSLRELSDLIADISTVSSIDTLAVLEALISVIPGQLLEGRIVRLGDFGSFRLNLSSEGVENEADFNKSHIKGVKLNFRPGKLIQNALKSVDYKKV